MDIRALLSRFLHRNRDLDEEIAGHLRMSLEDRVERGEDPREAAHAARREFGNASLVKEITREMWSLASWERLIRETRYAIRGLMKSPGFTAAATFTLAIGLAAAGILFGVVNTVLLRPLPFPGSDRILTISETIPFFGQKPQVVTLKEYLRWRASGVLAESAALDTSAFTLLGAGPPERVAGVQVTSEFFQLFGIQPALGRAFRQGEDKPGAGDIVILSHRLWARKFHSDPDIVGKPVRCGDELRTVIGVMPRGFDFPRQADLAGLMSWAPEQTEFWIPFQFTQKQVDQGNFNYLVLGRLAPGVSLNRAQQRFQAITYHFYEDLATEHSEFADLIRRNLPGIVVHAEPLEVTMTRGIRPGLWILFGAVALLLVLIYANLANLFLTRSAGRLRETAIRQALGASGWQIFLERFIESAVFGVLGGGLALLFTIWGTEAIRSFGADRVPRLYELTIDYRGILFLGALAIVACLTFCGTGLVTRVRLQEHNRTTAGGRAEKRLRAWLVTAEIALSLVLLVSAALLLESFRQVLHEHPGFDVNNLLVARAGLQLKRFPKQDQQYRQFERLLGAIRRLPDVEAASMANAVPLTGGAEMHTLRLAGNPGMETVALNAELRLVDPDYLRTMHIPLLRGRWFRENDGEAVTVVSDNLAPRFWPGRNPLGQQLRDGDSPPLTIVGVVGAVRNATLEREPTLQFYTPAAALVYGGMDLLIRTRSDPESATSEIRRAVFQVDSEQPLAGVRTMRQILDATTLPRRFETWLFSGFAGTALFLAALGVFGVLSLSVTRRTREFGIRMALGATADGVLRLVLGEASRLLAAGLVLGVLLALLSARFLRSLLYGITPSDPRVYAITIVVLVAAGMVACWIPARRAAHADPAVVLREE